MNGGAGAWLFIEVWDLGGKGDTALGVVASPVWVGWEVWHPVISMGLQRRSDSDCPLNSLCPAP